MEHAAAPPFPPSPSVLRGPRRGRPPQPPWSSRCRSGRVRPLRLSRCVRPRSRHTARRPAPDRPDADNPAALWPLRCRGPRGR
eukprot:scaffold99138_cov30-Tisochrysis_lutea.AAC.1